MDNYKELKDFKNVLEQMQVYKTFVLWLVGKSIGVEWDFWWNIFVPTQKGIVTLNLVRLASVYTWSRYYLVHFYWTRYSEHATRLRFYQLTTAWYDALHVFDDDGKDCLGMEYIHDLQHLERDWTLRICKRCHWTRSHLDYKICKHVYERDLTYCTWCEETYNCYDCNPFRDDEVFNICNFHQFIAKGEFKTKKCECVYIREVTDEQFMRTVQRHVPLLRRAGWKIFISDDKRGLPNVEIYAPYQYTDDDGYDLDHAQELACQLLLN